jgi:hypothetical protein
MRYIMQPNASASAARGFLRVGCTRLLGPAWGRATGPALWSHCPRFLDAPENYTPTPFVPPSHGTAERPEQPWDHFPQQGPIGC